MFTEKSLCLLEIKSWPVNIRSVYTYWIYLSLDCGVSFIIKSIKKSSKEVLECIILQLCPETCCWWHSLLPLFGSILSVQFNSVQFNSIQFTPKAVRTNLLYYLHLLLQTSIEIYGCWYYIAYKFCSKNEICN